MRSPRHIKMKRSPQDRYWKNSWYSMPVPEGISPTHYGLIHAGSTFINKEPRGLAQNEDFIDIPPTHWLIQELPPVPR